MYPSLRLAIGAAAFIAISMPTVAPLAARDDVVPPRLTWDCDCPMSKLADPAALPHFAAALRQKNTIEIVAIGSSSTFGIGASTVDRTYPFQLQDILESTFKSQDFFISNSGIGGEVAAQTAKRVMNEVALKLPDLVLWQVGTNDVLAGVPVEEFKATVQSTLRWLKYHQDRHGSDRPPIQPGGREQRAPSSVQPGHQRDCRGGEHPTGSPIRCDAFRCAHQVGGDALR